MVVGFAYSAIASMQLYGQVFSRPPATGQAASIDDHVASLHLTSAQIRDAVERAGWLPDADVALIFNPPHRPGDEDRSGIHFGLSYLLYPRRIWLRSAPASTRHAIVIGSGADAGERAHRVSDVLMLVDLP